MWIEVDGILSNLDFCTKVSISDNEEEQDYRIDLEGVRVGKFNTTYLFFKQKDERDTKFTELREALLKGK